MVIQSTRTMDELFEFLELHEETADPFEVEYHDELGYPIKINIDPTSRIADDEITLEISNVVFSEN